MEKEEQFHISEDEKKLLKKAGDMVHNKRANIGKNVHNELKVNEKRNAMILQKPKGITPIDKKRNAMILQKPREITPVDKKRNAIMLKKSDNGLTK